MQTRNEDKGFFRGQQYLRVHDFFAVLFPLRVIAFNFSFSSALGFTSIFSLASRISPFAKHTIFLLVLGLRRTR